MTYEQACKHLGYAIEEDGGRFNNGWYLAYLPGG